MAEVVPQTDEQALQQFLSDSLWNYQMVMDQVAGEVNALLGGDDSAFLLDETGVSKKGKHSVGVARQWCGRLGKVDNCQVGVLAALAKGSDSCLIDVQLFLPLEWIDDPKRCDKARVPREKQYPYTKIDITLEFLKRARDNGINYGWKGPIRVEAQHARVWGGRSAQAHRCHLLVKRESDGSVKYSISNAVAQTSMRRLLYMQGQRHFIERSFQDSKSHLGLDQYQARNWNSWHHHMALIMMAIVYLLQQRVARISSYSILSVVDMVFVFATKSPSRRNNLEQALEIIEQRHRKRQREIELKSKRPPKRRSTAVKQWV